MRRLLHDRPESVNTYFFKKICPGFRGQKRGIPASLGPGNRKVKNVAATRDNFEARAASPGKQNSGIRSPGMPPFVPILLET
jgi:hypothetical protein